MNALIATLTETTALTVVDGTRTTYSLTTDAGVTVGAVEVATYTEGGAVRSVETTVRLNRPAVRVTVERGFIRHTMARGCGRSTKATAKIRGLVAAALLALGSAPAWPSASADMAAV